MPATRVLLRGPVSAVDYRFQAGPPEQPCVEQPAGLSIGHVRKGGFGYRVRGQSFEMVAGALVVGHPGDEYLCTLRR